MKRILAVVVCLQFFAAAQQLEDVKFYNLEKEYRPTQTYVYKVQKAKALELKQIVNEMLSIYGNLYVNEQTNELYITDVEEKIADLKNALPGLDIAEIKAGNNLVSKLVYLEHQNLPSVVDIIKHKLSSEGTLAEVPHLNAFTLTDIPSKIAEVEGLLKLVDVAGPHIGIEISVVEFNNEHFSRLGINVFNWLQGLGIQAELYGDRFLDVGSSGNIKIGSRAAPDIKDKAVMRDPERDKRVLVAGRVSIADIVGFICEKADGSVLANTRIVTTNNKSASISAQEIIPFRFYDNKIAYQDPNERAVYAGVRINVLPTVQQDSLINLRVIPIIGDLTGWSPKGMPIVFERSLSTEVKVKDNSIFVLGGLKKRETVKIRRGIPGLKEIPLLRFFFSVEKKIDVEREVLIFIKPTTNASPELSAQNVNRMIEQYEQSKKRKRRK